MTGARGRRPAGQGGDEERLHQGGQLGRAFQVDGVAGSFDQRDPGLAADGGGHLAGDGGELGVPLPGHQQGRRAQAAEPVPEGLLGAGAEPPQSVGQPLGGVGQPVGPPGRLRREGGEQRPGQPAVQERRHPVPLDPPGQGLVGGPPLRPTLRVGDPRRGPDQHQPRHQVGPVERQAQAEPPAERVPAVHPGPAGLPHQPRRLGEPHPDPARPAVPGQVHPDHLPPPGQPLPHRRPGGQRLGEPVHQHHPPGRLPPAVDDAVQGGEVGGHVRSLA